ncbi:hypothetical protein [Amphiplicatus metriothermophilus]|uniref:UrcA family protein n=1 Tax=Amphiplicatus metriothermophilus TaxID=1519374 RepID=A0A239PT17_9PROT|nr:hypothetical protein [Amphiplicatus metriothermophilus]MBB5519241.1 hypothetical protein [Amphiplicatus metriothermophilus]SNT73310.1 hypothetical protein SAMN06297382_1708 [Amphiplicatus metriothermophilus]
MRNAAIVIAAATAVAAAPAWAASSYEEIAAMVKIDAFAEADEDWRRRIAMRTPECGRFGDRDSRRIDVLVERYNALADAVAAGDEAAAMAAGERFAAAAGANARFEKCWREIARRGGVKSRLARAF